MALHQSSDGWRRYGDHTHSVARLEIVRSSARLRSVSVHLWCAASANPDRVIDVLHEATMLCPSLLESPPPSGALTGSVRVGATTRLLSVSRTHNSSRRPRVCCFGMRANNSIMPASSANVRAAVQSAKASASTPGSFRLEKFSVKSRYSTACNLCSSTSSRRGCHAPPRAGRVAFQPGCGGLHAVCDRLRDSRSHTDV